MPPKWCDEDAAFGGKAYPPSDWLAAKEAEADQLLRRTRATLEAVSDGNVAFHGESLRDSGQRLLAQRLVGLATPKRRKAR